MHNRTLIVCTVLLISVLAGVTAVSAQESPTPTAATETAEESPQNASTPTPTDTPEPTETPTPTPTETPDDENATFLIEINPSTRIVWSEWADGELTFLVESDRSQTVTVTDSSKNLQDYEATDIKQSSRRVPPGETKISFAVEQPDDAAVTVGASSGGLVGLSPNDRTTFFPSTPAWQDVWFAGLGGGLAGLGAVLGIGWMRVSAREDDHEVVL